MLDLTTADLDELPDPVLEYRKTTTTRMVRVGEPFSVQTLEGTMTGTAGDYLAVGVQGERYPVAAAVQAASYVQVEES